MQQVWSFYFVFAISLMLFSSPYMMENKLPGTSSTDGTACDTTYLSDLNWVSENNPLETIHLNQSVASNPLTIGGQVFTSGLGVHAPSEIVYDLNGQYQTFSASVGVDDGVDACGDPAVEFLVFADGVQVFSSGVLDETDTASAFSVDITGVEELKLIVTDGGNDIGCDHADWGGARLEACGSSCTPGTTCDDGDPCTTGETLDANCNCTGGTPVADDDNDGVCDAIDACPGHDDNLDSDADGIPDDCDTNNTSCNTTFLSDLDWVGTPINGSGPVRKDLSNESLPMVIDGQSFQRGLGVHAHSELIYDLNGQYNTFRSYVGVDDEYNDCSLGSVTFEIYVDGSLVATSPLMAYGDQALEMVAEVSGANQLKLVVTTANGVDYCDHADWANARLEACSSCTPGTTCDDGDPCTTGETFDANCNCTGGTPVADDDNDGVCDAIDACPGHNDNLDSDADGIPDGCEESVPACQTTYLSDLNWLSENNPLETIHLNQSVASNPLTIGGQVFTSGLGVHAPSEIVYDLDGQYQTFSASVGLDDGVDACEDPAVEFLVFADGVEVFSSGILEKTDTARAFSVDVTGVEELKLIVTDGGNDIGCDHADWADAKLEVCDPITSDCYIDNSYNSGVKQLLYQSDIIFIGFDNDIGTDRDRIMLTNLVPLRTGTEFSITNANYCAGTESWYSRDQQDGDIAAQTLTYVGETALAAGSIICVEAPATGSGNELLLQNIMLNGSPTAAFSVKNGGHALDPDINLLSDQGNGLFLMQGNWKYSPSSATFTGRMISALRIGDTDAWSSASCSTDSELPEDLACLEGPSFPGGGSYFGYFDCTQFGSTFSRSGYLAAASSPANWIQGAGTAALDLGAASCTAPCFITCEELYWSVAPGILTVSCGTDYQAIIQDWLGRNGDGQYISSCAGTLEISHNYEDTNISFGCTPKRMPVTFTAKDQCGNMASVDGYIMVEDIGTPQFTTLPSNPVVSCTSQSEVFALFQDWINTNGGAVAEDNCGSVQVHSDPATLEFTGCNATVEVTFYAKGTCGEKVAQVATFTVTDDTAPTILVDPSSITLNCNELNFTELRDGWLRNAGNTGLAVDECSGGFVRWTYVPLDPISNCGTTNIEFTVTDQCGNSDHRYATLTIIDDLEPEIIVAPQSEILYTTTTNFEAVIEDWLVINRGGGIAVDRCSGNEVIWSNDYYEGAPIQSPCGSREVTFTVSDPCGNTTILTATLTVIDQDKSTPSFAIKPQPETISCSAGDFEYRRDEWLATHGGAMLEEGSGPVTWSYSMLQPIEAVCGNYEVIFTATNECGRQAAEIAVLEVTDNTPPEIDPAQPPQPLSLAIFDEQQLTDWLRAGGYSSVSDHCGAFLYWKNDLPFTLPDDICYQIPVTFSVTDGCNTVSADPVMLTVGPFTEPPAVSFNAHDGLLEASVPACTTATYVWYKDEIFFESETPDPGTPSVITPDAPGTYRVEVENCWDCGLVEGSTEFDYCSPVQTEGADLGLYPGCNFFVIEAEVNAWLDNYAGIVTTACEGSPISIIRPIVNTIPFKDNIVTRVSFEIMRNGEIVGIREYNIYYRDPDPNCNINGTGLIYTNPGTAHLDCGEAYQNILTNWINEHGSIDIVQSCGEFIWNEWDQSYIDQVEEKIQNCENQTLTFTGRDACQFFTFTRQVIMSCPDLAVNIVENANGDLCAVVSGCSSTAGLTYLWSDGATSQCLTPPLSNTDIVYTVEVSCGAGNHESCTKTSPSYTYSPPCPPDPTIFISYNAANGKLEAITEVCTGPIYKWYKDDNEIGSINPNPGAPSTYTPTGPGIYKVVVENCPGCGPFFAEYDHCITPIISDPGQDLQLYEGCMDDLNEQLANEWRWASADMTVDYCGILPIEITGSVINYTALANEVDQTIAFTIWKNGQVFTTIDRQIVFVPKPANCQSVSFNQFPIQLLCGSLQTEAAINNWLDDIKEALEKTSCGGMIWDPLTPQELGAISTSIMNCENQTITLSGRDNCVTYEVSRPIVMVCDLSVWIEEEANGQLCAYSTGCPEEVATYTWSNGQTGQCIDPPGGFSANYTVTINCGSNNAGSCDGVTSAPYNYVPPCPDNPTVSLDYNPATGRLTASTANVCLNPNYTWTLGSSSLTPSVSSTIHEPDESGLYKVTVSCTGCPSVSAQFYWDGCEDTEIDFEVSQDDLTAVIDGTCEDPSYQWYSRIPPAVNRTPIIGETSAYTGEPVRGDIGIIYSVDVECEGCTETISAFHTWCGYGFKDSYDWEASGSNPDIYVLTFVMDHVGECIAEGGYTANWTIDSHAFISYTFTGSYPGSGNPSFSAGIYIPINTYFDVTVTVACPGTSCTYSKTINDLYRPGIGNLVGPTPGAINVQPIRQGHIKLFPNPTRSIINLELESETDQELSISVFSPSGRQLLERQETAFTGRNTYQLDTRGLASGIYLMRIRSAEGVFNKKFLVVRN